MLELEFKESVTSQQRAWFQEAMSRMTFAKDYATVAMKITVQTVDEPPCDGESEYMCCQVSGIGTENPNVDIYIRTGADDPSMHPGVSDDIKSFFMESVVHEYAHAVTFLFIAPDDGTRADVAQWFVYKGSGRRGASADWNPLEAKWEDRIQEAVAEFFKDVWMPQEFRYFDNRTNWSFDKFSFNTWIDHIYAFLCPSEPTGT